MGNMRKGAEAWWIGHSMRDGKTNASIASLFIIVALRALGTHRAWNARSTSPTFNHTRDLESLWNSLAEIVEILKRFLQCPRPATPVQEN
jgi:hypothetical protein